MSTHDEIVKQVKALSLPARQKLGKSLISILLSDTPKPKRHLSELRGIGNATSQGGDAEAHVDQQQASAISGEHSDTLSRGAISRQSVTFRLQPAVLARLEEAYHQFKIDGIAIKQGDLRRTSSKRVSSASSWVHAPRNLSSRRLKDVRTFLDRKPTP